jgi:hypothetical protein
MLGAYIRNLSIEDIQAKLDSTDGFSPNVGVKVTGTRLVKWSKKGRDSSTVVMITVDNCGDSGVGAYKLMLLQNLYFCDC